MSDENRSFSYTYSAREQAEIKKIREKYTPDTDADGEADKMARLRRLDAGVTQKASTVSLCIGIISALIMGFGMSLIMTELGDTLAIPFTVPIGIAIGVVGMIGVILAYPAYLRTLRKEREKIAPEVIKLTDELLK